MKEATIRTEMLLGSEAMERLQKARVAVFGVGGVGGYVVEALTRSGIGALDLIDHDTVSESNLNRQILATHSTIGQLKVDVAAKRCKDINPDVVIRTYPTFYLPENAADFDFTQYDYIVDAIDTVTAKLHIAVEAKRNGTPLISSMGTGNKLNPTDLEVTDISKTTFCHLARIMRKELKNRGIYHLKVVYSKEQAMKPLFTLTSGRKQAPGSTAFVPATAGLIIASEVVKDLIRQDTRDMQK